MTVKIWSEYQKAIFNFVENGTGNAIIQAVPGAGKSSTLVQSLKHIPTNLHSETLFLAFNKAIVDELKEKVSTGITVATFHSFCLRVLKTKNPRLKVDNKGEKIKAIIVSLVGDSRDEIETRESLESTIALCKAYLAHDAESIADVMEKHEIESPRKDFVSLVIKALDLSARQNQIIDFNDMIWFISRFDYSLPSYSFVMVDEAQDSNPGRIDICRRLLGSNTRMIAVGDRNQVIFQFAGSCEDSMDQLQVIMNAKRFPLTISYRCAKNIVSEAQKYIDGIEASPTASDGTVEVVDKQKMLDEAAPGDFILSRVNAPLVSICLNFLREGKKCNIQGRDMGKTLGWMIKSSKAKDCAGFLDWLLGWASLQKERIEKKGGDIEVIDDRVGVFDALMEGTNDLNVVKNRIKELFSDIDPKNPGLDKIILSSVHRAKGKERERVWLLAKGLKPGKSVEENNLCYVGVTRAKSALYMVQ